MTIGFSQRHPSGTPTLFKERILLPYKQEIKIEHPALQPKIHTFRLGNRWKAGMRMHMVYGNRTQSREQFNVGVDALEYCVSVQKCTIVCPRNMPTGTLEVRVDGKLLNTTDLINFMWNDGFDTPKLFFDWFGEPFKVVTHVGQIIHFTQFKY